MYEWGSAYDLKFMYVWGWKFLFPILIRMCCIGIHAFINTCMHTYMLVVSVSVLSYCMYEFFFSGWHRIPRPIRRWMREGAELIG